MPYMERHRLASSVGKRRDSSRAQAGRRMVDAEVPVDIATWTPLHAFEQDTGRDAGAGGELDDGVDTRELKAPLQHADMRAAQTDEVRELSLGQINPSPAAQKVEPEPLPQRPLRTKLRRGPHRAAIPPRAGRA